MSSTIHADDREVIAWVENVIVKTFSFSSETTPEDNAEVRKNYTNNAWFGITGFFDNYMQIVKEQRLTLHPVINGQTSILEEGGVDKNILPGVEYWRFNIGLLIPELHLNIDFSIVVINAPTNKYLIQSLDMKLH